MDESLKDRALGIFEKDQKQLEGAFDSQSDVKAVGIVSTTTITEKDDGTYEKTVKEENAEDLYYDGGAVGKVENQLKEDAETLQAFCKDFDDQFITINAQINAKKNQMISLATEASERNCWPGIAYTALTIGGGTRPLVTITNDFSSPYTIIEDRTAMEIYKPMAGPDVNYGAENPFEPTSLVTLTSANSGFGHENLRDNGRLEPEDAAREVIADNYNVGGNNPGEEGDPNFPPGNEYLTNFQSSSTLGSGRTDVSTTHEDHYDSDFPKEVAPAPGINYSWWYAGVGVAPDATNTLLTGTAGRNRCVGIANSISALISEIKVLRQQRDDIINLTNYNKIKDKKMEKELQNWGANNVRSEQEKRKTANSEVISIINNL